MTKRSSVSIGLVGLSPAAPRRAPASSRRRLAGARARAAAPRSAPLVRFSSTSARSSQRCCVAEDLLDARQRDVVVRLEAQDRAVQLLRLVGLAEALAQARDVVVQRHRRVDRRRTRRSRPGRCSTTRSQRSYGAPTRSSSRADLAVLGVEPERALQRAQGAVDVLAARSPRPRRSCAGRRGARRCPRRGARRRRRPALPRASRTARLLAGSGARLSGGGAGGRAAIGCGGGVTSISSASSASSSSMTSASAPLSPTTASSARIEPLVFGSISSTATGVGVRLRVIFRSGATPRAAPRRSRPTRAPRSRPSSASVVDVDGDVLVLIARRPPAAVPSALSSAAGAASARPAPPPRPRRRAVIR